MIDFDAILDLETPHGFLVAQGKQTAIARTEALDTDKKYLIASNGEAFGVATLDQPAQIKTKDFDSDDWLNQHRITQRERRQWWPDSEAFYIYRIKEFNAFEEVKLFEDGQVFDEPRLTREQWQVVSKAKELPKTIIIDDNFISLNTNHIAYCGDKGFYNREVKTVIDATFNEEIVLNQENGNDEIIPIYSLALVRNPRMRVAKKKLCEGGIVIGKAVDSKQEGDDMPYRIRERDGEFCVVKINPDDSDGETEGCHENREEAQAQLTALNINVVAEEENAVHTDKPKKRKPKKKEIFGTDQSIDQQLNFIRRQFEDQFNPDNSIANVENYVWVNDIFDSFIIVDDEGKLFRVDYIMLDDEIIFSSKDRWVEVERGYRPKGFKVLKSNIKPRKKEMDDSTFFKRLKLAAKNILDIVTLAETEHKEVEIDILTSNYGIAQKEVNGELWHFTWSTNAFEDREKEIFSTKALENYVKEAEKKADRGYFNLWHINAEDGNFNTDFARKEWQGVVGRFLVEAGPYLDNEKGQAAKEFFSEYSGGHPEIAPEGWGCSPEFRYLPEERATGIYDNIWITRTSTLPKMAAANIWTDTRQLKRSEMLTEDQMKSAVALFGKDYVDSLLEEGNKRTEELENAGVAHKEKSEDTETEQEVQQVNIDMEELAAEVGKQFSANLDPIADAISTMTSTIKELQERLEKVESDTQVKAVTESPRFQFNLTRASESDKTVVTEDDKLNDRKPVETTKSGANDPWSQIFNK